MHLAKGDLRSIGVAHVEQVLTLARRQAGNGEVRAPGISVERSFNWLRFVVGPAPELSYEFAVHPPARIVMPGGGAICFEVIDVSAMNSISRYNGLSFLDVDRLQGALAVRNWRPGDRYSPKGSDEKIKHLFQHSRTPVWERQGWPIVTSGGKIMWARQFGTAAEVAAGANTRTVLSIREEPAEIGLNRTGVRKRLKEEILLTKSRGVSSRETE
jgi:tRNA(Ile)-lysidine synthase